jgi:hypothetical protein
MFDRHRHKFVIPVEYTGFSNSKGEVYIASGAVPNTLPLALFPFPNLKVLSHIDIGSVLKNHFILREELLVL